MLSTPASLAILKGPISDYEKDPGLKGLVAEMEKLGYLISDVCDHARSAFHHWQISVQAKQLDRSIHNLVANENSSSDLSMAYEAFKTGYRAHSADHGERRTLVYIQ